jgi:hypothetical protein
MSYQHVSLSARPSHRVGDRFARCHLPHVHHLYSSCCLFLTAFGEKRFHSVIDADEYDLETCTSQLKSQPVLNLIITRLLLALATHSPTIRMVLAASCFNGSSPAQRSALHGQETCMQLDRTAK